MSESILYKVIIGFEIHIYNSSILTLKILPLYLKTVWKSILYFSYFFLYSNVEFKDLHMPQYTRI